LEVGLGVNGIGNRIDWTEVSQTTYALANPLSGNSEFAEHTALLPGSTRVSLPIGYTTSVAYNATAWMGVGDVRWGLGGTALHGGYEYRVAAIQFRGGAMYVRELWNPSAGIGLNVSAHTGLDVAVFGNAANAERKRHPAIAVSVRLQ